MSGHGRPHGDSHSLLEGVIVAKPLLPKWQYEKIRRSRERRAKNPIGHILKTACGNGRKKPVTLPTTPFNFRDDA